MQKFHNEKKIDLQKLKKLYKCVECDYRTDRKDNINRHIISLHKGKEQSLCQKGNLERHTLIIHDIKGKSYKCPICNSEFAKEHDFIKHVSTVHERKSPIETPMFPDQPSSKENSESKVEGIGLHCKFCKK